MARRKNNIATQAPALDDESKNVLAGSAEATENMLTNTGINRRRIKKIDLAVGDTYELTESDLGDESLMSKVDRAVELGVLARS